MDRARRFYRFGREFESLQGGFTSVEQVSYPHRMTAPAGWYADGNGQRYWDGSEWTDLRAPGPARRPWSGISIAGFFCGISAILFWLILPVSVILSILSVVFMFVGLRDVKVRAAHGSVLAVFGGVFGLLAVGVWIVGAIGASV